MRRGRKAWITGLLLVVGLLLANDMARIFHLRLDLTADRRYTLSPATYDVVEAIRGPVYVKSYLGGELPLAFTRFRQQLQEVLEEYRVASGYQIEILEEDPYAEEEESARRRYHEQLMRQGIRPVNIQERDGEGGFRSRLIFPALTLSYGARQTGVNLYTETAMRGEAENIDHSLSGLEYAVTSALRELLQDARPGVAFVHGHGELSEAETSDWCQSLRRFARVSHLAMPTEVGALDAFEFVVIADPERPFLEVEKLVLDQYLMRGGGIFLMCNPVRTSVDSLQTAGTTFAHPVSLNLEDLLFRYGLRIQPALIQDMQCAVVPVNTALPGQPARFTPMPWVYFPLLTPSGRSDLTRNILPVYSHFPSLIELPGGADGLRKEVFLASSQHARVVGAPCVVSLEEIRRDPLAEPMPQRFVPVGVRVEGEFQSAFRNRPRASISGGQDFDFLACGSDGRLVVISEGRVARNEIVRRGNGSRVLPLGFDRYTQQTFGNRDLVENISLYLLGEDALLGLRGKRLTPRLLDMKRIHTQRRRFEVLNMVLPIVLLLLMGGSWALVRRMRYRR